MIKTGKQLVRSTTNSLITQVGLVTGAGAASMTIAAGLRGVSSIEYVSTGVYYVNYTDLPAGTFLGAMGIGTNDAAAAADMHLATAVKGSFDTTNKRFTLQVTDLGATPALADPATDEQLCLQIFWAETAKP